MQRLYGMDNVDAAGEMKTQSPIYCIIQSQAEVPEDDLWLTETERAVLKGLRFPKRRAEWRLGRWTAKRLIQNYLEKYKDQLPTKIEIRAAKDGAPEVFFDGPSAPIALSISHTQGRGFCAISPASVSLGCDLEWIEPRSEAFIQDFFTPREMRLLTESPPGQRDRFANLIWSAKESALKALREGLRRDTRSVEVVSYSEEETAGWKPLRVRCRQSGKVFCGWWREEVGYLQTLLSDSAIPKPENL